MYLDFDRGQPEDDQLVKLEGLCLDFPRNEDSEGRSEVATVIPLLPGENLNAYLKDKASMCVCCVCGVESKYFMNDLNVSLWLTVVAFLLGHTLVEKLKGMF